METRDKESTEAQIEKKFKKRLWWTIVIGIVLISLLWFWNYKSGFEGTFGDKFGVVNSLFSGLAFAGIIITIYMQKHELELQRRELKATRDVFEKQSKIMTDQQNDNTFFNLLENHRQLVNSFTKGELKYQLRGKSIAKGFAESHVEVVSGYEVLSRIANKWRNYCESYSKSYQSRLILDLNLWNYESFDKMVDSDIITQVFYRELLHVYKFIDKKFSDGDVQFYRDTLYRSLTQDERFIFEAIYSNFPNHRENVLFETEYYKRHNYVRFSDCHLPFVKIFESGRHPDYARFNIEHNSHLISTKMLIYDRDFDNNYALLDLVNIPIELMGGTDNLSINLQDCIMQSNLGLTSYPFNSNAEKLKNRYYAFILNFEHYQKNFQFAFGINADPDEQRNSEGEICYRFKNFKIVELSSERFNDLSVLLK